MQNILKLLELKINLSKFLKTLVFILIIPLLLSSCKSPEGKFKLPGGDARKFPADPAKRVEQNLKEGRGFRINDAFGGQKGGVFDLGDGGCSEFEQTIGSIIVFPSFMYHTVTPVEKGERYSIVAWVSGEPWR